MRIRTSILCILLYLMSWQGFAQNRKIDSLTSRLKTDNDTTRILDEIKLCQAYNGIGDFLRALDFGVRAASLAKSLEVTANGAIVSAAKRGEARAYLNIGSTYDNQGNYAQAMVYYTKALHAKEALGDKQGIANANNNIGLVYWSESNYPVALDYFLRSQNMYAAINNKGGMALTYNNIGMLYMDEQNDDSALSYYQKSLAIELERKNKDGLIMCYNNIGIIYHSKKQNLQSLEYYFKSLALRKEEEDKAGIAVSYTNIAGVYQDISESDTMAILYINTYYSTASVKPTIKQIEQTLKDSAFILQKKALELSQAVGDMDNIGRATQGIGSVYIDRKDYKSALGYYITAASVFKKINSRKAYYNALENISTCYEKLGKTDSAFSYFKQAMDNKDSVFNEEKQKAIGREEVKYAYEKQHALEEAQNQKERAVEEVKRKQQQLIIYAGTGGVLLLIAFLIFIVQRLRITNRQKNIIGEQKEKIDAAFSQLGDAKKLLEERHKDLTDSIQYASRIQNALLTSDKYLAEHLKEYFILFKPKDIVSGDFYWALQHKGMFYIACCDCTGHGVPGAFMSLLNITFLQQAVIEKGISKPNNIFNQVRDNVILALNPDGKSNTQDGMDATLCAIDFEKHSLMAACANNGLWILRDKQLIEFKPDKMPIGISGGEAKPFMLHESELKSGDCIYMFSDGYADQFGGPDEKKFKQSRLRDLLVSTGSKPMNEQKAILEKAFVDWQGNMSQIDDVCVIGIRI
jgi:serine phosphatase RsbU (regulator of sigma subunit)/Tfp pilus assembly protein PilF